MFLAIDIGNTDSTIGYFRDRLLRDTIRIQSRTSTIDEIGTMIVGFLEKQHGLKTEILGVGISSVVPDLTKLYCSMVKKYLRAEPKILDHNLIVDFRVLYDDAAQLGTDRLANVIAARKLYGYPVLVIDLGTATKYEIIDNNGDYLGGLIAPGIWTGAQALFEKGARLFPVKLEEPEKLIGTNTIGALQSGIFHGFLGQLVYLKERIGRELGYPNLKVVGTGGYVELFKDYPGLFNDVDPGLTLKGIEIALNR
ncbi:MAG TPA: pantothenate kinase [candidate division Zixibacteria bacterium]|jgi:type III pantothenate kinase|nr:pantothenate kinase [candidate division Zixibacteria bacterium]HBZ01760.1 pantothenate kinase [candidate division Zixibacteria bacterium]